MDKDLGKEPMPVGENNIAYTDSSGRRARGVVALDEDGNQTGIRTNPTYVTQGSTTAFGESLTAQLYPIIQLSFEYTVDNIDLVEKTETNGGTVTQSTAMAVCNTSATTASVASFRSHRHGKYRPGIGGLMRFTALFTIGTTGTEQFIGLLDEVGSSAAFLNGYVIGYDGVTFGVHRFQNDVKTTIALSACDDPLDGTGRSGMVMDTTKHNVFEIRFQFLGAGAIEFGIEDDVTGKFIVFHRILYANKNTSPSVFNPNFHMVMHAANKGTTDDITIKTASMGYFSEGITNLIETHQPQNSSGLREKTSVTTEVAIFTIRVRKLYNSYNNFIDILLENIMGQVEASSANNLASVRLVRNATLGGTPSWADISTSDSVVEIDVAGTTVTGGKEVIVIPLAGKNDSKNINMLPYQIQLRHDETLTIAGTSANSATIDSALLWKELF